MNTFTILFKELDQTSKTTEKVAALKAFFSTSEHVDCLWALALFTGKISKRTVNSRLLKNLATEIAGISDWLFEESYGVAGDLAETISLLVTKIGQTDQSNDQLADWMAFITELQGKDDETKKALITAQWKTMSQMECLVFNKLITGGFRIGVSQSLVIRGISEAFSLDPMVITHRIMGNWDPKKTNFQELIFADNQGDDLSRPYPFYLAHPLEKHQDLGDPALWQAEWKWDGIRCQIICRGGKIWIWSRGEELISDKFPELNYSSLNLPDGTVLDGELLAYKNGSILPFQMLQTRINRKNISKKQLDESPAVVFVYDILEWAGNDYRTKTMEERRKILENLLKNSSERLFISETISFQTWDELKEKRAFAREKSAEGLMLKRLASAYQVGRKRGDWWKWKLDPMQIDGVLIYAQKGHGNRADLFTDYTFAVWDGDKLVSFAKAYSGLTDVEIRQVDAFVKKNTFEKFGPVRTVKPELVFEIGFEGIQASPRHKSGIALRFPRILRWRKDKKAAEADTIESLKALLG